MSTQATVGQSKMPPASQTYLVNLCVWNEGVMEVYPSTQKATSQDNAIRMARTELGIQSIGTPIVTIIHNK